MEMFNDEIERRKESNVWSKNIAGRVIKERSRRTRRKLTVVGSIFVTVMIAIAIGINVYQGNIIENSWENYFMSAVYESVATDPVPEKVDKFIEYSFNGN
jgi:hypothetical protein